MIDRALTLLISDLERRRCATVGKPRTKDVSSADGRTRHIPAAVRREVWKRDQGRCAFTSDSRRCTETSFLEFHHVAPYAAGGLAVVDNIQLRCRAHNRTRPIVLRRTFPCARTAVVLLGGALR